MLHIRVADANRYLRESKASVDDDLRVTVAAGSGQRRGIAPPANRGGDCDHVQAVPFETPIKVSAVSLKYRIVDRRGEPLSGPTKIRARPADGVVSVDFAVAGKRRAPALDGVEGRAPRFCYGEDSP